MRGSREPVNDIGVGGKIPPRVRTGNYDWHVDLSNATGNARGKALEDYTLVLEQDFTDESLFGVLGSDPVLLPMAAEMDGGTCSNDTFDAGNLCQQSWNPAFGNTDPLKPSRR